MKYKAGNLELENLGPASTMRGLLKRKNAQGAYVFPERVYAQCIPLGSCSYGELLITLSSVRVGRTQVESSVMPP